MNDGLKGGEDSNRSANPSIHEVSDPARRVVIKGTLASTLAALFGSTGLLSQSGCAATPSSLGRDSCWLRQTTRATRREYGW